MTKKNKRHQVKSKFYYIFWGIATVSVFVGQLYVGTGYHRMSESLYDFEINISCDGQEDMYVENYSYE